MALSGIFLLNMARVITVTGTANSHVEANVPQGRFFDEYLKRDLQSYFCWEPNKACRVDYELLRNGPTQSGLSYPKYYLWVRCFKDGKLVEEGAVRVEAVEQNGFSVTHFLSRKDILASSDSVTSIFPAPLADKIIENARRP